MPRERCLSAVGFDGIEASDLGNIRRWDEKAGEFVAMKPFTNGGDRLYVRINGQRVGVAHVVLAAFVGPRPPGMFALHRNDVAWQTMRAISTGAIGGTTPPTLFATADTERPPRRIAPGGTGTTRPTPLFG